MLWMWLLWGDSFTKNYLNSAETVRTEGLYGLGKVVGDKGGEITLGVATEGAGRLFGAIRKTGIFNGGRAPSLGQKISPRQGYMGSEFLDGGLRMVEQPLRTPSLSPSGAQYSVAYQMELLSNLYPGKGYSSHFKAANVALEKAMASDATFAAAITDLRITIPRSPAGNILGKSPTNWVWYHNISTGIMELTPKSQHTNGNIFLGTMHPNGVGGMAT